MVVDAAGAGLEINCPGCGATLTVPKNTPEAHLPGPARVHATAPPSLPPAKKRQSHKREHKASPHGPPAKVVAPPPQGETPVAGIDRPPGDPSHPPLELPPPSTELLELQSRLARTEHDLDAARTRARLCEEDVRRAKQELTEANKKADAELVALRSRLEGQLERLREDAKRNAGDLAATASKAREAEAAQALTESRLLDAKSALEESRLALERCKEDLASKGETISRCETRIAELESQGAAAAASSDAKISGLEVKLDAASKRIAELEGELAASNKAQADAQIARDELAPKLESAEAEVSRLRADLENGEKHAAALARDLSAAREDSAKNRQECALMRSEREATRTEANRLRREVHEAIDRLQRTTSLKERLEEDLREAQAELEGFRSGEMTRENKVLKGIIERRNAEAQKEREEMVRGRRNVQALRRWVALLLWITGFSLIAAIIEAVLLWARFSPLH